MRVTSKNKIMDFSIIGYQFPDYIASSDGYDYDANWLLCEIKYTEGNYSQAYRESCILTYELQELTKAMENILNKKDDAYISDFLEPYLKIAITRAEEKVVFTIQYVYDTTDGMWKKRTVSSVMDEDTAMHVFRELTVFQKAYSER